MTARLSTERMSLALTFTSGTRLGLDLASPRAADYRKHPARSSGPASLTTIGEVGPAATSGPAQLALTNHDKRGFSFSPRPGCEHSSKYRAIGRAGTTGNGSNGDDFG